MLPMSLTLFSYDDNAIRYVLQRGFHLIAKYRVTGIVCVLNVTHEGQSLMSLVALLHMLVIHSAWLG